MTLTLTAYDPRHLTTQTQSEGKRRRFIFFRITFPFAKTHFPTENCIKWVSKADARDKIGLDALHLGSLGGIGRGAHKTKGHLVPGII